MDENRTAVKKCVLKDKLKYNGVTLVKYTIEYPKFCSAYYRDCVTMVNEFYRNRALEFRRYCETLLFDMAIEQYKGDIENNYPVHEFEAFSSFKTTYLCSCIISIYSDQYEFTGGAHGNTVRDSQTWNLRGCGLMALSRLVNCVPDYRSFILAEIEEQINRAPEIYFENYAELIDETFNESSFYCTRKGVCVYYQQYDIAPYSSGIREFLIPYSSCVTRPERLC
ncbi:MAG: DUF3298 and DUF4163 domain-containing protein [Oscillospiraceae bacterium]|nr:DUF3298 and DUF4163 domain-containing protein [Oscillospiraceae bacterium]